MSIVNAWLHHISVVVVADTYRPDAIHKYLVSGTIQNESEITQSHYVPDVCDVWHHDGTRIAVTAQQANIGKNYNESFEQCTNAEVYTLATKFVEMNKDVSYRAIGLNWTISLPHDNPLQWMTQKFLKDTKSSSTNVSMMPQFVIKTDKADLTLVFKPGEIRHDNQSKSVVVIHCNHHHTVPFKTHTDVLNILTGWKEARDNVLSNLGEVIESK